MKPAQRIWSPVSLLEPVYMAPALRMVSPVREHSPVRAIPPCCTGLSTGSIQPGRVGQVRCSRPPVRLHGPVYPVLPPRHCPMVAAPAPGCLSVSSLQVLLPAQRCQSLPSVLSCHGRPSVRSCQSRPSVRSCQSRPSVRSRQSRPSRGSSPELPELRGSPERPGPRGGARELRL